jgi:hypothetical protein
VITREEATLYAHCRQHVDSEGRAAPGRTTGYPCRGYEQQEVPGIVETTSYLFGDYNGGSGDPLDALVADRVSHSVTHLYWADRDRDCACPFCGEPREIADQIRPIYDRISENPPDQILRIQRDTGQAAVATASAVERLADQRDEMIELRRQLAEQREEIAELKAGNGKPRAARKPAPETTDG